MRRLPIALIGACLLVSAGCYRHDYYVTNTTPEQVPTVWTWNHHLFWGLVRASEDYPLDAICPQGGVSLVENWMGPLQAILSWLTAGIYTPTTVRIYCNAGPKPFTLRIRFDRETLEALRAAHPDLEDRIREALAAPGFAPASGAAIATRSPATM